MFLGIYFIEAGLLLIVAPWTTWWDRNYFADLFPGIRHAMSNESVHVLVAAAGVLTVMAGMAELRTALAERWARRADRGPGA